MELLRALETEDPPEAVVVSYYSSDNILRDPGKLKRRLVSLQVYLNSGKPIYTGLLRFALLFGGEDSFIYLHPRLLAFQPVASKDPNWFMLTRLLITNGRIYDGFRYAIDCLALGVPLNVQPYCSTMSGSARGSRLKAKQRPLSPPFQVLLVGLLWTRSTDFVRRAPFFYQGDELAIKRYECWMRFKLLMAICDKFKRAAADGLKTTFTCELGRYI